LPPKDIEDVLSFSYASLLKAFHSGGKIEMSGLGTFVLRQRKARLLQEELEHWLEMYKEANNERRIEDLEQKLLILKTIRANEPAKEFKKNSERNLHTLYAETTLNSDSEDSEE